MEKLDLASYRKLNESFNRKMVCRIGIDCGFFVEMNYMVNAMLYCLEHRIRFQLYSDDANFGTGVGWTEYFLPFCEEIHDTFHQKYNFHRLPSWRRILKHSYREKSLQPIAWKTKAAIKTIIGRIMAFHAYGEYTLLAQDVSMEQVQGFSISELGINGSYMDTYALVARMIWRLNPDILRMEETYRKMWALPPVFSGVQIRGGDKITETFLIDGKTIIQKLKHGKEDTCLFILTDDYSKFLKAHENFPGLRLFTLCQKDETGYHHKQFCKGNLSSKKDAIQRLLISVDMLLSCKSFAGSITTGPSVFVMKLRHNDPQVLAVDCPKEELATVLRLPIDIRSMISKKNL